MAATPKERLRATRIFSLAMLKSLEPSERADVMRFLVEYNGRDLS